MGAIARRITRVITAVVCVAVSVGVSVATLHVPTREGGGERFNPARYRSDVIADTVINHTTGVDKTQGTGTAGSPYDNKGYFPEAGYIPCPLFYLDVPRRRKRVELPGIGFAGP